MDQEQLDRIEEKLDKLLELFQDRFISFDYTATYPKAPHEIVEVYPLWRPHETSSNL